MNPAFAGQIGADGYEGDGGEAVEIAKRLLAKEEEGIPQTQRKTSNIPGRKTRLSGGSAPIQDNRQVGGEGNEILVGGEDGQAIANGDRADQKIRV